ncbi:hypothetical protein F6X40_10985 [Paraburkholderia sp. UCT31]|uniref:hypothetical protein n=1 Tax=Paraburkholderia sp. UCT31 TaxID=2615209 RepID=UPI001655A82A|nr:hypothetical protein [Paraburkholderia sp. UCT31]MBC8737327.1 hypothetical protein [Paraburkholderia sp. UCT31]
MSTFLLDAEVQDAIDRTSFVVLASSFEKIALCQEAKERGFAWHLESTGFLVRIGELNGQAMNALVSWASFDGYRVMFISPASRYSDSAALSRWLDEHCDPVWYQRAAGRRSICEPLTFSNCLSAIREFQKAVGSEEDLLAA